MEYNIIRYIRKGFNCRLMLLAAFLAVNCTLAMAQEKIVNPTISYAGTPRVCEIGGIAVKGVKEYEDYVLAGLSGLEVGQQLHIPGNEITEAVKRYWKHGLFSQVSITADSIVGSKIYLCIHLNSSPDSYAIIFTPYKYPRKCPGNTVYIPMARSTTCGIRS